MNSTEKTELKTLTALSNKLTADGFTENFRVEERKLKAPGSGKSYEPSEVKIINFYRFEGESDPADNAILYAVETNDGVRGQLTDAYGAYADAHVTKFVSEVEEIMKKTNPEQKL